MLWLKWTITANQTAYRPWVLREGERVDGDLGLRALKKGGGKTKN